MTSYPTRNNAFSPPQTWVLDGETLQVQEEKRPPLIIPLRDITEVRLEFAPTRFEINRYRCELTVRGGKRLEFFSRTYEGAFSFRETIREYNELVRQLHAALPRANPACRFSAGASRGRFIFGVLCFAFAGLVVVGAIVFFAQIGLHYISLIKALLILAFAPVAVLWIRRNRPRTYEPHAIPPHVMPRAQ